MKSNDENKYAGLLQIGNICNEKSNEGGKESFSIDKVTRKKRKGRIVDASKTAEKGYFLDVPEFICRSIK